MFEFGGRYRRKKLLDFCGSRQTQVGIIWGDAEPGCVICTSGGKHKSKSGYADEPLPDGSFLYFGQGTKGNQDAGKFANQLLIGGERTVLLFLSHEPTHAEAKQRGTHAKEYEFAGTFSVGAYEEFVPKTGTRKGDRLLRFHLVRSGSLSLDDSTIEAEFGPETNDLEELRQLILQDGEKPRTGQLDRREYVRRSRRVRKYALLRASGTCELCREPAPFLGAQRRPFLEVHHLHQLGDGGPDRPENVAAICPNCHRAVHHSIERATLSKTLEAAVKTLESNN